MIKYIIFFTIFLASSLGFALHSSYDALSLEDHKKLEELCNKFNNGDTSQAMELAHEYSAVIQELKEKYPNLQWSNPCSFK